VLFGGLRGVDRRQPKTIKNFLKERGIGQPAISKQISALEDELGTELILFAEATDKIATVGDGDDFFAVGAAPSLSKLPIVDPRKKPTQSCKRDIRSTACSRDDERAGQLREIPT